MKPCRWCAQPKTGRAPKTKPDGTGNGSRAVCVNPECPRNRAPDPVVIPDDPGVTWLREMEDVERRREQRVAAG